MTWISLVCLLALSGAAFSRSVPFDGYGSTRIIEPPIVSGYGRETLLPEMPTTRIVSGGYGSSFIAPVTRVLPAPTYGGYGSTNRLLERSEIIVEPPSPADILCRGQLPQTVIPIEGNRKFVVCLEDGKGTEQSCPKGLLYHEGTRRCERKLGPLEDFCASQPCLNGGLCISTDSTFQCQCPAGFDGIVCELDARFCQNNRPCGTDPSVRCQSFRPGAALEWICVSDDDFTYGPDGSHIHRSPCDPINIGPHPLAFTNKGFIMCNGELSHYESCPGGTIWETPARACVWPDMEEVGETRIIKSGYGGSFMPLPPVTRVLGGYDNRVIVPRPKVFSGYGETRRLTSNYGGDFIPAPMHEKVLTGYGGEVKRVSNYGGDFIAPAPITKVFTSNYGAELPAPMPLTKVVSNGYGGDFIAPVTKTFTSNYGAELPAPMPITKTFTSNYGAELPAPMPITKTFTSNYGGELAPLPVPEVKVFPTSSYGSSRVILPAPVLKTTGSYGGY